MLVTTIISCNEIKSENPPELAKSQDLERQVLQHRAIEAVIWGMPAVNRDLMYQAMLRETKGRDNQMLYWSRCSTGRTRRSRPTPT
jgi:hypothetical protein